MPNELNKLFICQVIGWIAFFSTTLFFTDFIAQVLKKILSCRKFYLFVTFNILFKSIYKGEPAAPPDSSEFYLYNYGTKMGSLCLIFFSISSSFSAGNLIIIFSLIYSINFS